MKVKLLLIAMFLFAGTITTFANAPVKLTNAVSFVKSNSSILTISTAPLEKNIANGKIEDDCFNYCITEGSCPMTGVWCQGFPAFLSWLIQIMQEV